MNREEYGTIPIPSFRETRFLRRTEQTIRPWVYHVHSIVPPRPIYYSDPRSVRSFFTPRQCGQLRTLLAAESAEQPVCDAHYSGLIPITALFCVFDGVFHDPPLLVEFEDEDAAEVFGFALMCIAIHGARDEVLNLIHGVLRSDANRPVDTTCAVTVLGFAACLPLDNEFLFPVRVRCCAAAIAHHALR